MYFSSKELKGFVDVVREWVNGSARDSRSSLEGFIWALFILFSKVVQSMRHVRARCGKHVPPTIGRRTLLSIKLDSLHTIWELCFALAVGFGYMGLNCRFMELLHPWILRQSRLWRCTAAFLETNVSPLPVCTACGACMHVLQLGERKNGSCFPSSHDGSCFPSHGADSAGIWMRQGATISVQGHLVQDKTGRIGEATRKKFQGSKYENVKYDSRVFNLPSRACVSPSEAEILGPKQSIEKNS